MNRPTPTTGGSVPTFSQDRKRGGLDTVLGKGIYLGFPVFHISRMGTVREDGDEQKAAGQPPAPPKL